MPISPVSSSTAHAAALVQEVDFPGFVSGLIEGVFDANVDASVKQMQAYAGFMTDEIRHPPHDRQQTLSTMALMGINRIVVTDGKIGA